MKTVDILMMIFLISAWTGEATYLKRTRLRRPTLTLTCCGLLLVCLFLQLAHPELLNLFQRDTSRIVAGEWWRMGSALFFQDGWLWGGITNVIALFWMGGLVEQERRRRSWLIIGLVGAFVAESFGLRWQPIGAGNSVATCSLAGSLIFSRPLARMPLASKVPRGVAVILAVLLGASRDLHGIAAVTGVFLGVMIPIRDNCFDTNKQVTALDSGLPSGEERAEQ